VAHVQIDRKRLAIVRLIGKRIFSGQRDGGQSDYKFHVLALAQATIVAMSHMCHGYGPPLSGLGFERRQVVHVIGSTLSAGLTFAAGHKVYGG
jgi:hypothetical protein